MKKKHRTYQEFADYCGGVAEAVKHIGVDPSTYSRWLTGVSRPRGIAAKILEALNVGPR